MHQCPRVGCLAQVPRDKLACYPHWMQLPRPIRNAVLVTWQNGAGLLTPEYRAARARAIEVMNRER